MEESLNTHRLLEVIRILASNRESGRLQIRVGAMRGEFFFKKGQLADARMGPLTGFPAVNAAVSIQDARFSFDPSIPPPTSSFNTLNERAVLKQLFGIETVDPEASNDQVTLTRGELIDEEAGKKSEENDGRSIAEQEKMAQTSPAVTPESAANETLKDSEQKLGPTYNHSYSDDSLNYCMDHGAPLFAVPDPEANVPDPEANLVRGNAASAKLRRTISFPLLPASESRYRRDFYVAILLLLMGAVAVALVQELNERRLPTSAAQPSESSLPLPTQVSKQIEQRSSGGQNLTGQWKVVNIIEKTSHPSFTNLELGFRLVIRQTGTDFTAEGEKVSENGRILPATGRTPIHLTGSIDGERVEATFMEKGLRRKTSGRFVWRIENAGAGLSGTFVSTAARTSGTSAATKEL